MMAPAEAIRRFAFANQRATEQRRLTEIEATRAVASQKGIEGLLPFRRGLRTPVVHFPGRLERPENHLHRMRQIVPEETSA